MNSLSSFEGIVTKRNTEKKRCLYHKVNENKETNKKK